MSLRYRVLAALLGLCLLFPAQPGHASDKDGEDGYRLWLRYARSIGRLANNMILWVPELRLMAFNHQQQMWQFPSYRPGCIRC